jgi:hypothetical protein|tara:strand:- start:197 stop:376 length:180 start_codon:yes stop_codon:yes gene_type:complete
MGVSMINHLIIVRLNNVHKDEQKELRKYLRDNSWSFTEIDKDVESTETFERGAKHDTKG